MACRGVHFAIETETMQRLLAAKSDADLVEIIQEEIEEKWDEAWLQETDKAWDALHRCFTGGLLNIPQNFVPLPAAILGGEQLHAGDDYIISLVRPERVREVADALASITRDELRKRYDMLDPSQYDGVIGEEDFEYSWSCFEELPGLFDRAAQAGRAVIFTVDQ